VALRRWERRAGLAVASAGLLMLLTALSLILVDGGLSRMTMFLLFAGLALVIAYAVIDPSIVTDLARDRRARFGSLSVLISALVIGILVAVNVIGSRGTQAADLTRAGLYTLSPKSVLVAHQLDSDLQVTGFFRPGEVSSRRQVQTLLDLYRQQTQHIKISYLDPDQNAAQAQSLGVTIAGSIVLQYKARPPVVLNLAQEDEANVTGAMLRLVSNRTPVVCWAAGDGERDLTDTNQITGYSAVADLLKTSNYKAQNVLLPQQGVPSNCDTLVLLQLSRPLADNSVKAVQDYLARGGALLIGIDPWANANVLASANRVLQPYNAHFDGGLVIEPDPAHSATGDSTIPVVTDWSNSPITRDLANQYVFFPVSTSVIAPTSGSAVQASVANTSDSSYSIPQQRTDLNYRSTDKKGPFTILQSLEQTLSGNSRTRIVMSGTSALGENRTMPPNPAGSNGDLFLASLDWLTAQDNLIAIGPKPAAAAPLTLTDRDTRINQLLTLFLLPLVVVAAGVAVWWRRRRHGAPA
jgi:ABC-type uncharacterized transport system involved in gliding motility auxiliary subunit